ncbi:glycosyltransferase [Patescibacteria group bacterium]
MLPKNELAIVILHHNTPKEVTENLEALQKAELPERTEIVVVDNGEKNGNGQIPESCRNGLNVRFFDIPNKGFPQGNNFGIEKTDAEYIAMVNPDIVIDEDTFTKLLSYFKNHPKVGVVAPRLIYPSGKVQDNYRVFPRPFDLIVKRIPFLRKMMKRRMGRYLMWDKDAEKNEPVDWFTGAFQVVTRKCWDEAGPNSEDYFLFMSDVVICRDAWEKGYEVHFVGEAKALHNEARLSEGGVMDVFRKKTMRIHIKDSWVYFKKYLFKKIPKECPSVKTYR